MYISVLPYLHSTISLLANALHHLKQVELTISGGAKCSGRDMTGDTSSGTPLEEFAKEISSFDCNQLRSIDCEIRCDHRFHAFPEYLEYIFPIP